MKNILAIILLFTTIVAAGMLLSAQSSQGDTDNPAATEIILDNETMNSIELKLVSAQPLNQIERDKLLSAIVIAKGEVPVGKQFQGPVKNRLQNPN